MDWVVAWASVIGLGHTLYDLPCQDNCAHKFLENGWALAVVADGAGSCEHAEMGSDQAVALALKHFEDMLYAKGWHIESVPSADEWREAAIDSLALVREGLRAFADIHEYLFSSLSCTIIVCLYHQKGILMAHIGDGRGGYLDVEGEWKPLMIPFRGKAANETIFLTSDIWTEEELPFYLETRVIPGPIQALALMSDGCEKTAFACNIYDEEKNAFSDPNLPFPRFFNPNVEALRKLHFEGKSQDEINELWTKFLDSGMERLKNEPDDKTMILSVVIR